MASDEDTVDIIFKTIKVPGARGGAYGLNFLSSCPVMLCDVDRGSPADKAGLKPGDFLVQLNGNDIQRSSEEAVRTIIKYSHGAQLTIRIARPHPFPSTDYLRRRAIIILQTKLAAGVKDTNEDAITYKKTVESAFLEVQDILGSLGLGDDDLPPSASKNSSVQEVKVQYHGDSDSLESPPGSDKDPFEVLDPLLDFGLDDDMTISHGKGGGASAGADLMKSTFEVQRALQGIKQLTDGLNAAKEEKRLARERGQVTTEATFTGNFQSSSTNRTHHRHQQPSPSPPPSLSPDSSRSPQETSPSPPPPSLWSSSSAYAPPMNGVRERAVRETREVVHSERKSNGYEQRQQSNRAVSTHKDDVSSNRNQRKSGRAQAPPVPSPYRGQAKAERRRFEETAPPPIPPYQPREESSPSPVQSSSSSSSTSSRKKEDIPPIPPYNPAGPEEFLLSNKPEYKQERRMKINTYETVRERERSPSPPPDNTYEVVRERVSNPRAPANTTEPQPYVTTRERSLSPPPPVPVRQHANLSKTFSEPPTKSSSSKDKYKDISLASVPLRSKKRGGNQGAAPAQEPAPVGHVEQSSGGKKMKYNLHTSASSLPVPVKDVTDVVTACAGLPSNVHQWKKDEVGMWLKQLSPTLYNHYSSLFSKHDVTGRTLLRLNATKLQSLGVTTPGHCRILATEIMRVRIHQEANELRAFRR